MAQGRYSGEKINPSDVREDLMPKLLKVEYVSCVCGKEQYKTMLKKYADGRIKWSYPEGWKGRKNNDGKSVLYCDDCVKGI